MDSDNVAALCVSTSKSHPNLLVKVISLLDIVIIRAYTNIGLLTFLGPIISYFTLHISLPVEFNKKFENICIGDDTVIYKM